MHPVAQTRNGMAIVVDLVDSQAALQIAHQPYLVTLAATLLARSDVTGDSLWLEGDMGRMIGNADVVETAPTDTIYYAQRQKSDVFVRLVKNRKLEPTSLISLELHKVSDTSYSLRQILLGHAFPPVPNKETGNTRGRKFWTNHALVAGDWPIKSSTITKECPWEEAAQPSDEAETAKVT